MTMRSLCKTMPQRREVVPEVPARSISVKAVRMASKSRVDGVKAPQGTPRARHALSQNHGFTVKCLVTFCGQGSAPSVAIGIANLLWEWAASWSLFRVVP